MESCGTRYNSSGKKKKKSAPLLLARNATSGEDTGAPDLAPETVKYGEKERAPIQSCNPFSTCAVFSEREQKWADKALKTAMLVTSTGDNQSMAFIGPLCGDDAWLK